MFTRVVELTSKPGKSKELSNAINGSALPILQNKVGSWTKFCSCQMQSRIASSRSVFGKRETTRTVSPRTI